jgi:hypothetical protein
MTMEMLHTPEFSTPTPRPLFEAKRPVDKRRIVGPERTATHSGKLGDIIYALPAVRALGIRHLILNVIEASEDPLRVFPFAAAQQLVPLLLAQNYLERVSIVKYDAPLDDFGPKFPGVDYNFDFFRRVARHRVGKSILNLTPRFAAFAPEDPPAHLCEIFSAALGIRADFEAPWLHAPASPLTKNRIVISITKNWRSYPNWYWKELLRGLPQLSFVGHAAEWKAAGIPGAEFIPAADHFELASLIQGARLFLGTVSFPYAIAEGLKVTRAVEICHRNLNAFPVGPRGNVLPPNIRAARALVARLLADDCPATYQTSISPRRWLDAQRLRLRFVFTRANESYTTYLKHRVRCVIRRKTV